MDNALTVYLWKTIDARFRSPEDLSHRAGLTGNTVRNILKSGSAKPETLRKLAPHVGKSPKEMFVLAGWLDAEPTEWSPEADEAARLIDVEEPAVRVFLLEMLRISALGLQRPELRARLVELPREEAHQESL